MAKEVRKQSKREIPKGGSFSFVVQGPIPRTAPYAKGFRGRLYVPNDLRAWRAHVASNFLLGGGRKPYPGEQPFVTYGYTFKRSHADIDSITHSSQDALTKDALSCADKEWWGVFYRRGVAKSAARESLHITVYYGAPPFLKEILGG